MLESVTIAAGSSSVTGSARPEVANQLRGVVAAFASRPEELRDGFSLQLGWGPFILRGDAAGFVVESPDYAIDSDARTDDLTLALWVLVGQLSVLTAASIDAPKETSFQEWVVLSKAALDAPSLVLTRIDSANADDSGWFVDEFPQTAGGYGVDDLVKYPAYNLLKINRHAARVLQLPPGISAVVDVDGVRLVYRESDHEILANGPM